MSAKYATSLISVTCNALRRDGVAKLFPAIKIAQEGKWFFYRIQREDLATLLNMEIPDVYTNKLAQEIAENLRINFRHMSLSEVVTTYNPHNGVSRHRVYIIDGSTRTRYTVRF